MNHHASRGEPLSPERGSKRREGIPFAEMAAIQAELQCIDRQLEDLQGTQPNERVPTAHDILDPTIQAMIGVELCAFAASGSTEEMRILLQSGADPNTRDYEARSLLHIACMNNHLSIVELLLSYGADATQIDAVGKYPAEYAEAKGLNDIVDLLNAHLGTNLDSESVPSSTTSQGPDFSNIPQPMTGSLVLIMVGLPGRGKTYVSRQICRYFQWNGLRAAVFSEKMANDAEDGEGKKNRGPAQLSRKVTKFISQSGGVAIVTGRHETFAARQALVRELLRTQQIRINRIIFIEIVNDNPEEVYKNIMRRKEFYSPVDTDQFVADYYHLIQKSEAVYDTLNPVDDADYSYIRVEDREIFSLNQISGWMPSRLAYMLHNLNQTPTTVYLSRPGEYVDGAAGRIGGNSSLTARGFAYSQALFNYFKQEIGKDDFLSVMCSCATRATQTSASFAGVASLEMPHCNTASDSAPFRCRVVYFPSLDDINHGDCEGMLFKEVKETMPFTLQEMREDPYNTPWPNGECLHQVFNSRLEPHIHDIHSSPVPVLVISHLPLLQGLHSYFVPPTPNGPVSPQSAYTIDIPKESVIKIHMKKGERIAIVVDLSKEVDTILANIA